MSLCTRLGERLRVIVLVASIVAIRSHVRPCRDPKGAVHGQHSVTRLLVVDVVTQWVTRLSTPFILMSMGMTGRCLGRQGEAGQMQLKQLFKWKLWRRALLNPLFMQDLVRSLRICAECCDWCISFGGGCCACHWRQFKFYQSVRLFGYCALLHHYGAIDLWLGWCQLLW